jgi:4-amino-4-deoxy-L-arabinose transferase-like glycosyltransferase
VAALVAMIGFLFVSSMGRALNHDEHQFIAPAILLLRAGLLPYCDYPFFHMPDLVFIFAGIFSLTSRLLLAARCFNVLCATLLLLLIFAVAARAFCSRAERRWLIALGFVLVLSLNPFFRFTAGRAWNHDLPMLAAVAAFLAFMRAGESKRALLWMGVTGGLVGIAAGTRLSFAPLVAPFALAILIFPVSGRSRISCLTSCLIGLILALLPVALLFLAAPSQFIFDNFTWNGAINRLYRVSTVPPQLLLLRKLGFPFQEFLKSPSDVMLIVGFTYFALRPGRPGGWLRLVHDREIGVLLMILPFLFIGSWAPAHSFRQYYYPFVPFLLLGNIIGLSRQVPGRLPVGWLFAATLLASFLEAIPDLTNSSSILRMSRWPVVTVHQKASEISALLPEGRILTLAPIFPLEAGLRIYPEFATGPFAWRTASLLDEQQRTRFHLIAPSDLERFLDTQPPEGILTGFEHAEFEQPLKEYARARGYVSHRLMERGNLRLPAN